MNSPLACIDPTGLFGEWYIKTTTEKKEDGGTVTTRTWEEFDSNPGDDWTRVEFGSRDYIRRDNVQVGDESKTVFFYCSGGSDDGERAKLYDAFAGFNFATAQFSQIVPKSIALRNPQVRAGAADAMWSGAAVYNGFAGTYNLGAWGANSAFGDDSVPYAPILSPDEKTSRHRIGRFASVTELFEETETIAP